MSFQVIFPERLAAAAHRAGFEGNVEAGAWLLAKTSDVENDPWTGSAQRRLIVNEVVPLAVGDVESASATHLTVRTESFVRLLQRARGEGLVVGFLHGHPSGHPRFSARDDDNERALWLAARNRNGDSAELVALLALPDGTFTARIRTGVDCVSNCSLWITGARCRLFGCDSGERAVDTLDRQARAFGEEFNRILGSLSVTVVGAGGTGSPLAMMLARAGVGRLAIIDDDLVEATNLHRLHGARSVDVGLAKAKVLEDRIRELGLPVDVRGIAANVLDPKCRDVLKASDFIFCATDDHAGRMLLNRFAYFYEIPVIDIGLALDKGADRKIRDMTGRVTLLHPGVPCLLCRRILDPRRAREEELRRRAPADYAQQAAEGYVLGGGAPEPAFIGMTTSVACMALDEFTQALSGYRGDSRSVSQRFRRFHVPEDRCVSGSSDPDCPICASPEYWGQGDMIPFLDRVG